MGSVMRRTSSILTVSRPGTPSIASDDNASIISGSIKAQAPAPNPLPVITPSPIIESPLGEIAAAEETLGSSPLALPATSSEAVPPVSVALPPPVEEMGNPTGYIPPPVLDSTVGNPGAFTDEPDELPQPRTVPPVTLPPPVEEIQSPTGYIPPPVLDSSVGNPGAFTDEPDELPQPQIAQDPYAVAPVEPHVEPASVDAPKPATVVPESTPQHEPEPEATLTGALVEEPASYFHEPIAENIKDSGSADHGQGEAAEYYLHDIVPTTSEALHESANIVLPVPEAHHHDDFVPVATESETQEAQEATQPIAIPVPIPLPNYELSSYPMNLGSGEEVWGGEGGYGREALPHPYPSSVPIIIPNSEDLKRVERSPAPSIRFVDFSAIRWVKILNQFSSRMPEADPFADPIAPRISVSHPEFNMPQYVSTSPFFITSAAFTNRRV